MEYAKSSYLSLPSKAGIYVFLDKDKQVLYVGKANDLKSRVSSYFTSPGQLGEKTKLLVEQIKKIKVTFVETELEALLLEAFYIKQYRPKYNIKLIDGKAYLLIRITMKDAYPKVLLARREDDPQSLYFGPFPNARAVRLVLKIMRRIFPYQSVLNHPNRICLYHHLGLCPCPPVFSNSQEFKNRYRKNIQGIIKMLEGGSKKLMAEFEKERDKLSKEERYEEALVMQQKITALSLVTTPFHKPFEYDVNPNLRIDIRTAELTELMTVLNKNGYDLSSLHRIECYDISNTQGTHATGSMVVFTDGEKDGSEYRRFKIKKDGKPDDFAMMQEVLKRRFRREDWAMPDLIIVDGGKGQVSSATEVLQDYSLTIPLIGLAKREETIVIPNGDSVIARSKMTKQSIKDRHATLAMTEKAFTEISLPKSSKALLLLMRIRDEAHRFAITYHKKLRNKNTFT